MPAHLSRRPAARHPRRCSTTRRDRSASGCGSWSRNSHASACGSTDVCPYDDEYFAREDEEYALADWHCAASSVVREQLISLGIDAQPHLAGAVWRRRARLSRRRGRDRPQTSASSSPGQVVLRKGLRTLLDALDARGAPDWRVDFYGGVAGRIAAGSRGLSRRHTTAVSTVRYRSGAGRGVPRKLGAGAALARRRLRARRAAGAQLRAAGHRQRPRGRRRISSGTATTARSFPISRCRRRSPRNSRWWAEHPRRGRTELWLERTRRNAHRT